jgi:hypothetical protein
LNAGFAKHDWNITGWLSNITKGREDSRGRLLLVSTISKSSAILLLKVSRLSHLSKSSKTSDDSVQHEGRTLSLQMMTKHTVKSPLS